MEGGGAGGAADGCRQGTGSRAKVKLAKHVETGEKVAIKIINGKEVTQNADARRRFEREMAVMRMMEHPHVLRLHEVYETDKKLYVVMENVSGGDLYEYMASRGRLQPDEALLFLQQIVSGLHYCHRSLVCHRDLRPENILLDSNSSVKLSNFGKASLMKNGRESMLQTSCGSPHYAAPEVISGKTCAPRSLDSWAAH